MEIYSEGMLTGYRHVASHGHIHSGRFDKLRANKSELAIKEFLWRLSSDFHLICLFLSVNLSAPVSMCLPVAHALNCLVRLQSRRRCD